MDLKRARLKTSFFEQLELVKHAQRSARFSEIFRRPKHLESVTGYLVEFAPEALLVEELHWDSFRLNGLTLLSVASVGQIHVFDETEWPVIAAKRLGLAKKVYARRTKKSYATMLNRLIGGSRLVQIQLERANPGELFLCEILKVKTTALRVRSFDRSLRETQDTTMLLRDITKVTAMDGYSHAAEEALDYLQKGEQDRS